MPDARGLLIPDDIASNLLKSKDSATFWSSNQFYIKAAKAASEEYGEYLEGKDPASITATLSTIPDSKFRLIKSLCLDFGWGFPDGFIFLGNELVTADDKTDSPSFREMMREILRKGNKNLVIKILWSTTMSYGLERLSTWRERDNRWGIEFVESRAAMYWDFRERFEKIFRAEGWDEERVRVISRCEWKEEVPDEIGNWDYDRIEEYEEKEREIFEVDEVEGNWVRMNEDTRISYGLLWSPAKGHWSGFGEVELPN